MFSNIFGKFYKDLQYLSLRYYNACVFILIHVLERVHISDSFFLMMQMSNPRRLKAYIICKGKFTIKKYKIAFEV